MVNLAKIEEYYLFNTVLRKTPDIWSFVKINSDFFQEIFSYFQICYLLDTEWPLFSAQIVLMFILMLRFVTLFFFCFRLVRMFLNIFPDFFVKYFFLPYHVCKQFVLFFFRLCKQLFSMLLIPLPPENNDPFLRFAL